MGRAVHPGPFLSSAVAAVSAVVAAGSGSDLLPGLADGSVVGTLALSGECSVEGDTLRGTFPLVPDGAAADLLVVVADDGVFAVERDAPGLDVRPVPSIDGTRKLADVVLDGTPARRLGDGGDALAPVVDRLLVAHVVDGVGAAGAALEIAIAYAKERVQFGKPIGSFQAVQHLCADMLENLELSRAGAYYALWADGGAEPAERHRAATMAKAFASDALFRVGADTIQVLGGIGFTWEHDAHLFYKRLLTLQHHLGGTSHHLEELASIVLARSEGTSAGNGSV
jgi:alkylation response protein AidB-like acyl-CoA dehydrogenase